MRSVRLFVSTVTVAAVLPALWPVAAAAHPTFDAVAAVDLSVADAAEVAAGDGIAPAAGGMPDGLLYAGFGDTAIVAASDDTGCVAGAVIAGQVQPTEPDPSGRACTAEGLAALWSTYGDPQATVAVDDVGRLSITPPEVDGTVASVLTTALSRVGDPYVWGGARPGGFDCSGLVQWAFAQHGVALPRTTFEQVTSGEPVGSLADAQPGDLLFFHTYARHSHVGLYVGEGRMLHAPRSGVPVRVDRLGGGGYSTPIAAIRRPVSP